MGIEPLTFGLREGSTTNCAISTPANQGLLIASLDLLLVLPRDQNVPARTRDTHHAIEGGKLSLDDCALSSIMHVPSSTPIIPMAHIVISHHL